MKKSLLSPSSCWLSQYQDLRRKVNQGDFDDPTLIDFERAIDGLIGNSYSSFGVTFVG
jgi:hypothetical protein